MHSIINFSIQEKTCQKPTFKYETFLIEIIIIRGVGIH